jgi:cytosine/adenosine deaminase-related metal-dependent hydrolase
VAGDAARSGAALDGKGAAAVTRTLLAGGLAFLGDAVVPRDILIEGARIAAVLPAGDGPRNAAVLDASRRLVLPGLVNAHTHSHANLMKGVADRWVLEASLTHGPWMGGQRDAATIRLSTLLGAAEMLEAGVTACYDLFYEFPVPSAAGLRAVAEAYAEVGLRAVIAPMVADRTLFQAVPGLLESLPDPLRAEAARFALAPAETTLAALREAFAITPDLPPGISLALAPTIPHHCSPAFLAGCRALAEAFDLPLHMHVAESRLQAVVARRLWGHGPVVEMDRHGLLGPRFTLAHGVWLEEAELDLLAERGAGLVHMPASNLRLGAGVAPLSAMLARRIRVGLGTDGCNSADSLDVLEMARLAAGLSRIRDLPRADWIGAAEALRMATEGGAALLGLQAGRIAPGMSADLALLDLDHRGCTPLNDPLVQAVTCNLTGAVREVFVAGRQVVAEGRCTAPAVQHLGAQAAPVLTALRGRLAPVRALAEALEPHVVAFAELEARAPLPVTSRIPVEVPTA